jgi:myo-inositol 2-dehydrogenase/D-chiro-inositol 1-dehydrogenase
MPVRVGVIGAGVMGAEHARLLSGVISRSSVSLVSDVDSGRAEQVAAAVGARAADDPLTLIASPDVDAVLIASSDATHEEFVLAALAAGKPVLCEKPLAPDVAGCERLLAAEQGLGRRLVTVGFMRRYDPAYQLLRAALRDGELGAPLLVHCAHRNVSSANHSAAQSISGSAVHEFDILRWLLDDEIETVEVHRGRRSGRAGCDDPILLLVRMRSGVLADIEVFVNATYGYEVRCEVVGETGTAGLGEPIGLLVRSTGQVGRGVASDWRARFLEAYRQELQEWVDTIADGAPPPGASTWDGYVATVVAQAGVDALDGRRVPVALVEKPQEYR